MTVQQKLILVQISQQSLVDRSATGNPTRIAIDSTGNVGIGTDSPTQAKLVIDSDTAPQILVKNSSGANSQILFEDNDGLTQSADITFDQSGNNSLTIKTNYAGSDLLLQPTAGNVGIGTDSPDSLLHIYNSSTSWDEEAVITLGTDIEGTTQAQLRYYRGLTDATTEAFQIIIGSTTALTALGTSGNVGIGTTDPAGYKLAVENTSEDLLKLHNSTDGLDALISFTNPGGTLARIQGIDNGGLAFDVCQSRGIINQTANKSMN